MNINVVAVFTPKQGKISQTDMDRFNKMISIAKENTACVKYDMSNAATAFEENKVILTEEWTVLDEDNFNSDDADPAVFLNLSEEHIVILARLQETFNLEFE